MAEYKINTNNAVFLTSAASVNQYPSNISDEFRMEDIVFSGKSNVGKSSLLNKLMNRKKLAKVSASPGKTRTINFFDIDKKLFFVDLPGYGYAKVSKDMSDSWGKMMDDYFMSERPKPLVIQLLDIRHKPTKDDISMINFLKHYDFNFIIVATKHDKLKKSQVEKSLELIRDTLDLENVKIIPFSSETGFGREELIDEISGYIKPISKAEETENE